MVTSDDLSKAVEFLREIMNEPFGDKEMKFAAASEIINLAVLSGLLSPVMDESDE